MSNTIVIQGTRGAGKTTMVKQFVEGKKAVWLHPLKVINGTAFAFSEVEKDTEIIVIEEVGDFRAFQWLIRTDEILVNKKGREPFLMPRPTLILTSNYFDNTHLGFSIEPKN